MTISRAGGSPRCRRRSDAQVRGSRAHVKTSVERPSAQAMYVDRRLLRQGCAGGRRHACHVMRAWS
jgi:hypothetical protein